MTKILFKTLAGSRLFGCSTKDSDYDYKGIHFQNLTQLLNKTDDTIRTNNALDDEPIDGLVETETYSLNYYMKLLGAGQVIPMDMLFAPKKFWTVSSPTWELIQEHREEFVSCNITPFIGYAKGQAMKYGLKGAKLNTIDEAIRLVEARVSFDYLCYTLKNMDGISFEDEKTVNGTIVKHILICGKSFGATTDYSLWVEPLTKLKNSFGKRAAAAMSTGQDLKAQYHTVRICKEATELLTTGSITFPRPEADILSKIRLGDYTKETLVDLIELCFYEAQEAEKSTKLRIKPLYDNMANLVYTEQAKYLLETM